MSLKQKPLVILHTCNLNLFSFINIKYNPYTHFGSGSGRIICIKHRWFTINHNKIKTNATLPLKKIRNE